MNILNNIIFFLVSFLSSIIGAICGIGGGVIIKPTLDIFGLASVSTISFLSGCTVLSMSIYSVFKTVTSDNKSIQLKTVTPLALGAAVGGVVGKQVFNIIIDFFENQNLVGSIQSACLLIITVGTLLYTIFKSNIKTHTIENKIICLMIGLFLGIISSFLGIGGGPINLVILFFFFSMDTKTAASNSLYIILFSQITSLISTITTNTVPDFYLITLIIMVLGGVMGGIIGRNINKKINNKQVDKLFILLMVVIIFICIYNTIKYAVL